MAEYGAVVLASSPDPADAAEFLAWFVGVDGQVRLANHGFGAPR